jgi:multidrug resistance efflux pump
MGNGGWLVCGIVFGFIAGMIFDQSVLLAAEHAVEEAKKVLNSAQDYYKRAQLEFQHASKEYDRILEMNRKSIISMEEAIRIHSESIEAKAQLEAQKLQQN